MAERISSQTTVQRNAGKRDRNENSTVAKPSDPNQESGTSPMPDFVVENHGSIFLLQPLTPAANSWIEEHLPEDHMTFGGAIELLLALLTVLIIFAWRRSARCALLGSSLALLGTSCFLVLALVAQ
jgi:hypothetical protein